HNLILSPVKPSASPNFVTSRITHSRHRTAIGGHHRTPSWSISYSRGGRRSLSDTGGHGTDTVRDREAPGSNPGPPTKAHLFEPASPALRYSGKTSSRTANTHPASFRTACCCVPA